MKKTTSFMAAAAAAVVMAFAACGGTSQGTSSDAGSGGTLGSVLSAVTQAGTLGNVLQSFIGNTTVKEADLMGTWQYATPGCAFSSEQLLAKAGGEAVAAQVKQKLAGPYKTVGINSANTSISFAENKKFTASVAGKTISGTYTFDEQTQRIRLTMLLLSIDCYAKKNSDGMGILFESTKLLTLFQTVAAFSGNSTLQTIGDLSKQYDGLRMGFDMKKK
jgi:hypothetical protein